MGHLRVMPGGSNVAEWGFVLGYAFWGTGIFPEAARLLVMWSILADEWRQSERGRRDDRQRDLPADRDDKDDARP